MIVFDSYKHWVLLQKLEQLASRLEMIWSSIPIRIGSVAMHGLRIGSVAMHGHVYHLVKISFLRKLHTTC